MLQLIVVLDKLAHKHVIGIVNIGNLVKRRIIVAEAYWSQPAWESVERMVYSIVGTDCRILEPVAYALYQFFACLNVNVVSLCKLGWIDCNCTVICDVMNILVQSVSDRFVVR